MMRFKKGALLYRFEIARSAPRLSDLNSNDVFSLMQWAQSFRETKIASASHKVVKSHAETPSSDTDKGAMLGLGSMLGRWFSFLTLSLMSG